MSKHWSEELKEMSACAEACEWAATQKSKAVAWSSCERPDWMLWYIGRKCRTETQRKKIVLCACACARLALKYVPKGEMRPLTAIKTAEAWARGKATLDEVQSAADAAYAAASAADATAYAAASAADATAYAAASAADAAYAAASAADATAYAAYAAAKLKMQKRCCAIIRKHFPRCPR